MSFPRITLTHTLLALLALAAPRAAAQVTNLYAMNETGIVSINGTQIDKLPSGFSPSSPSVNTFQKWLQLEVVGADRYALRLDGNLYKNGKSLHKLPFGTTTTEQGLFIYSWVAMSHGASGIYALREDGLLTLNGTAVVTLPKDTFAFTSCLAVPNADSMGTASDIYCLRSDGFVFKNNLAASVFLKFTGGPGLHVSTTAPSTSALDGAGSETWWVDLALDPINGTLRGLRRDGKVSSGSSPPVTAPAVDPDLMVLPYQVNPSLLLSEEALNTNRYRSLTFNASGFWMAVRGSGQLYNPVSLIEPFVDLPDGGDPPINDTYLDMVTDGDDFWTIRWDGNVYANTDEVPVLKLTQANYRKVAISHEAPDLTNFKNPSPLAQIYTATVVEGQPVTLPVYASDIELAPSEVSLTLQDPLKKPLPPGLVFNPDPDADPATPPTITWDNPTPKGTYTVPIMVSDSVNKPKTANFKIKVVLADTDPLKNKKPLFTKVKNARAMVGFDYVLPMFAVDPDEGDTVTLSVDTEKEPFFSQGAAFDQGTGIFTWKPTFDNIGKHSVKFTATDVLGAKKTYTVKLTVVSGFAVPPS